MAKYMENSVLKSKDFNWGNVPLLKYKEEDGTFRSIHRQVLSCGAPDLPCEMRYFEIAPNGHSTLESHEHTHLVMIIRGRGNVLIGKKIHEVKAFDVLSITSHEWHQFQTSGDEPFGFICIVNNERDRPHRPTPEELEELRKDPVISSFIRC